MTHSGARGQLTKTIVEKNVIAGGGGGVDLKGVEEKREMWKKVDEMKS